MVMPMQINTNLGAIMASAAASSVNKSMEVSMERLSTGKRINAAADDAAGVAISSRLEAEQRGLSQAIRNAMDAQSLIDTAEGAHAEIENLLQRMRELVVQAQNGTNSSADLTALKKETDAIIDEISNIAGTTSWAGITLTDGTYSTTGLVFQIGARAAETVTVTVTDIDASALGIELITPTTLASAGADITTIDAAIATLNSQRAALGAVSNRLDSTVTNLTNNSTNIAAGLSRIQDADYASESTNLTKNQILQQASTAMLAQANASKQSVLTLLQG
jgi:flagellin